MHSDPTTAMIVWVALFAGHHTGDYWTQSDHQALTKGQRGATGRRACTGHVASLTAAQALVLTGIAALTGTPVEPATLALGLAVNAASHYWADRRTTLRGLVVATEPITHKLGFHDHGGGAAHMDQAWHQVWLVPAALIIAAPLPLAAGLASAALGVLAVAAVASRSARHRETAQVGA